MKTFLESGKGRVALRLAWGLALAVVACLLAAFLLSGEPAWARPALQASTYTYTIAATSDSAVTMGDMADTLSFVVTNTGNDPAKPIDYIKLEFQAARYEVSSATAAPNGWSVDEIKNAGAGQAYVVYTADTALDALAPGESQTFSVAVLGRSSGAFAAAAADVIDGLDGIVVRFSVFAPKPKDSVTFSGNTPSWPRRGLATSIVAVPPSVAVGDLITVTMVIDNRSTALQQDITRTLSYTPAGLVTLSDGPIPLTLTLAPGASNVITHTYRALAEGVVTFGGSAANASVTSEEARSNQVVIGDFTALIEVEPTLIIAGQSVTVRMRVYNNTGGNLGNVRASPLAFVGTATVLSSSGPSPNVVPSLPAGSTTTFEWTYTLGGAVGSTYAFTGTARTKDSRVTNVALSNSGALSKYSAFVTPRRVGAGISTPLPLAFTMANNGGTTLQLFRFTLPPGFSASGGVGQTVGSVGAPCTWSYSGGDFTASGGCAGLPSGGTAVLTITFSSLPIPVVDTNYNFHIDLCSGTNKCTSGSGPGANWEGAVDVPFTITQYRVVVTANPTSLPADGFSTSLVTATVYEGGTPLPGAHVVFATTGTQGTLSAYDGTTNASGTITVTFTSPVDFVDSQAVVVATYLTAEGRATIDLNGFSGPNPLYVGGTLNPLAVQPGDTVAFTLDVVNAGNQPLTLDTGSVLTFTDGTRTFSANLVAQTAIPTDTARTLIFASALVDPSFAPGAYFPALRLVDTAAQIYDRPVSDRVSVGVAALVSRLAAVPAVVNVGQQITVTMMVTNVGAVAATNVSPSALTVAGSGAASQLSGPSPVSTASLASGAVQTFIWTYSATGDGLVNWTGRATGTDENTGQPVESSLTTSNDVVVMRPAQLSVALAGAPATVNVGQTIDVTMPVDNTGDAAANNVAPGPLAMGGTGGASYLSGPVPASVPSLSGGGSTTFAWTYRADSAGTVTWTGTATGVDANDGQTVSDSATSNVVTIQTPAALTCALAAGPGSVGSGSLLYVTMTVTNTGQAGALAVDPSPLATGGTGGANLVAGPVGAPVAIPGGAAVQFTWTYQASAVGTVNWAGNAGGTDANSGAPVSSAVCNSNNVSVAGAAFLVSTLVAAPDAVGQGETVVVTMTVNNVGTNAANGVTPSPLALSYPQLFPTLVGGPSPASADVAAGGAAQFVWTYRSATNRTGENTWTGNAAGVDATTGSPVSSLATASNLVSVYEVVPDKMVQTSYPGVANPGEVITYTIVLRNTSNGNVQVREITDTLPVGFTYLATTGATAPPDGIGQVGQTITWDYSTSKPTIAKNGGTFTLTFTAQVGGSAGSFCNSAGFTPQGGGAISRGGMACVTVGWPEYIITAQTGSYTIRARVRLGPGGPEILSWEILP